MSRTYRWFQPRKEDTGWHAKDAAKVRRAKARRAHKSDLATARSLQALANVTRDADTAEKARKDATFFFRQHRLSQKGRMFKTRRNGHRRKR